MTDKKKLHQILSSLWKNDDSVGKTYYNQALQDVQTAVDLQEEPVSDELEKVVEEIVDPTVLNAYGVKDIARRLRNTICGTSISEDLEEEIDNYIKRNGYDGLDSIEEVKYIANHFAKWQKEQMMANTADAMIGLPYENKDGGYTHLIDVSRPLPVGNNKIAIIFKED